MTSSEMSSVAPETLMNGNEAPHVAAEDVDAFLEMAKKGLIPAQMSNCGAMQDNISLRADTRVALTM